MWNVRKIIPLFRRINESTESYDERLLSSSSIKLFFKGINKLSNLQINVSEDDDDNLPPINCKYEDVTSFNYTYNKDTSSLLHNKIASLFKHKEGLEIILNMINFKLDFIVISENKIKKGIIPGFDISMNGYKEYSTRTESDKGGELLYIAGHINSIPRNHLGCYL